MQVSKILVALTVAAGFASASLAQGITGPSASVAPAVKVAVHAPAASEKKVDALKAAEPAKPETASQSETPKADAVKPAEKHTKAKGHERKAEKHEAAEAKAEMKAQTKAAAASVPVTK